MKIVFGQKEKKPVKQLTHFNCNYVKSYEINDSIIFAFYILF